MELDASCATRARRVPRRALTMLAVLCAGFMTVGEPAVRPGAGLASQPLEGRQDDYPHWVGQFTVLSGNALIGALTAGISQKLRGGSFQDGFTRGALGGAIAYAGKRIAVERFDGAGLVGRQMSAVGSSIVRNAAEARPSLERLFLPVGPVHVYVEPGAARPVHARVDLANLIWLGWAVAEPRLDFDLGASISSGMPVFRVPDQLIESRWGHGKASGLSAAGTILLSDISEWGEEHLRSTFAHERVHTIQDDFLFHALTGPLEEWLLQRLPGGAMVEGYIDINLATNLHGLLAFAFDDYHDRPWEMEAEYLEQR
ncbi:MAG TPA: hypothetical protein VNZ57_11530 [Longimicrobiales bacterium]|nr:hypothetical protein [Longimicrobiales bacterium]